MYPVQQKKTNYVAAKIAKTFPGGSRQGGNDPVVSSVSGEDEMKSLDTELRPITCSFAHPLKLQG